MISASSKLSTTVRLALLELERERAAQRAGAHLAAAGGSVAARLRAVRLAATDVVRRADRSRDARAGALLPVELARRARDLGAVLGLGRAGATRRELRLEHVVEQRFVDLGAEDVVGEVELADASRASGCRR